MILRYLSGHIVFLCEFLEIRNRIRTRRKHEDQWSHNSGVLETFREIEGRNDNELFADFLFNPILNRWNNFIRSNEFQEDDLLQHIQLLFPLSWQL